MLWIARTGAPSRDLAEFYGSWSTVYSRFRRWQIAGIWDRILELSRGGLTTKIHAIVDALRNPLRFQLTPGQRHDAVTGYEMLKQMDLTHSVHSEQEKPPKTKKMGQRNLQGTAFN